MTVDAEERDRLVERVEGAAAVVRENGGSTDPVAHVRVLEALKVKIEALGDLGRLEERTAVWQEAVDRFANDPPGGDALFVCRMLFGKAADLQLIGRYDAALATLDEIGARCAQERDDESCRAMAAEALSIKRDLLTSLGRSETAVTVDDELVRRFTGAADPATRRRVAYALTHRSDARLRAGRVEEALYDIQALLERFGAETDFETTEAMAAMLIELARRLLSMGAPGLTSIAATAVLVPGTALNEGVRAAARRLRGGRFSPGRWRAVTERASRFRAFEFLTQRHRRAVQALSAFRAVADRYAASDDPKQRELAGAAHAGTALAHVFLGHVREGLRALNAEPGGRQAAIAAFQSLAASGKTGVSRYWTFP